MSTAGEESRARRRSRVAGVVLTLIAGATAGLGANGVAAALASRVHAQPAMSTNIVVVSMGATDGLRPALPHTTAVPAAGSVTLGSSPPVLPSAAQTPIATASETREQEHTRLIEKAKGEPTDPAWAPSAARSLQQDLRKAGEAKDGGFDVVDVGCHMTSCVATLEWPSFEAAQRGYGRALRQAHETNCPRRIVLERPTDVSARYQATVLFDCEEARAAGL